ncbi:DUF6115 domain-containing protein [Marinicrinis sediminis]|uniref:DUF6115 domain-containing protein n=1 Tax=Marinicrinis sediminis TaxID=1652465 RepID=A0ABW5R657_9BACL
MEESWQLIALLGAVIVVFSAIQSKKQHNQAPSDLIREMEDAFTQFSSDISEDNERVVQHVDQTKSRLEDELHALKEQMHDLVKENERLSTELSELKHAHAITAERIEQRPVNQADTALSAEPSVQLDSQPDPDSIAVRYETLLDMHRQGKSIEHIAKSQGINKGEVQLIITLAAQEEQERAQK